MEEAAFRAGASAETLMNKAGRRLGETLAILHPEPGTAVAYVGRGNNGGDALVALQVLRAAGWRIAVRGACLPLELGLLPRRKLRERVSLHVPLNLIGKPCTSAGKCQAASGIPFGAYVSSARGMSARSSGKYWRNSAGKTKGT